MYPTPHLPSKEMRGSRPYSSLRRKLMKGRWCRRFLAPGGALKMWVGKTGKIPPQQFIMILLNWISTLEYTVPHFEISKHGQFSSKKCLEKTHEHLTPWQQLLQSMTRVLQRIHQDLFLGLFEHMVPLNPCVNHKLPFFQSTIWRLNPPFSDSPVNEGQDLVDVHQFECCRDPISWRYLKNSSG